VQYLNEAWTPYHAVLASCRRLLATGFQVSHEPDPRTYSDDVDTSTFWSTHRGCF
jgi:hypothetical protein